MLFEVLDERTKESYNRLLKENEEFKASDLQRRVLLAQLDAPRHYKTWDEMLDKSVVDTMDRIQLNFMEVFRGYDLRRMLPSPNSEENITQLFLANFRNVTVENKWEDEEPDLAKYIRVVTHKYYLFLITIHANTSENVRPGIVKAFTDYIKDYEDTKVADQRIYVEQFMHAGGSEQFK